MYICDVVNPVNNQVKEVYLVFVKKFVKFFVPKV